MTPEEWAMGFKKKKASLSPRALVDDLFKNPWAEKLTREQLSAYLKLCRYSPGEVGKLFLTSS